MKRSRLVALLLTLAVLLAAAPAMGQWVQAQGAFATGVKKPENAKIKTPDGWGDAAVHQTDLKGSISADVVNAVEHKDSALRVKDAVVFNYLLQKGFTTAGPNQRPGLFKISQDADISGDVQIVVAHELSADIFKGKKAQDIKVVKARSATDFREFTLVTNQTGIQPGEFVIANVQGGFSGDLLANSVIEETGQYHVVISFKVSSDYDVGSGDCVIDPVFFTAYTGGTPSPITGVTVAPASKVVAKGGTAQLTASVLPAGSTQTVTWGSDKATVTVSTTGLVTVSADAVLGTVATITATSTADATKKGTSTITVGTPVTGVNVEPSSATIAVGGTQQLTATLTPASPTISTVTWTSSNTAVATVSSTGLVTGVAAGTATITCTTTDGGFTATSAITVTGAPSPSTTPSPSPTPTPTPAPEPGPMPTPVPVPGLPGGIEPILGILPSSTSGLPAVYSSLVTSYGGRLVLTSSIIDRISGNIGATSGVSLPVFTGSVSAAGRSGAFTFALAQSGLVGQPVSSLRLIKVKSASSHLEFTRVNNLSDLADGRFAIVTHTGAIRAANDTVREDDAVLLVIKDNGAFDMDSTPGTILDPCFLAQSTRRGGGGGGCSAGVFAPIALVLAAPLLLLLKK